MLKLISAILKEQTNVNCSQIETPKLQYSTKRRMKPPWRYTLVLAEVTVLERERYTTVIQTHVVDGLYLTESHNFIPIIKVKKINLLIKMATAAKFNILKCEPMGTDSVLESASSGSQRNCGFGLSCIGLVVRTSLSTLLLHFSNQLNFIHL